MQMGASVKGRKQNIWSGGDNEFHLKYKIHIQVHLFLCGRRLR